ncbi:hypothetical protein SH668x_000411 [Planctomicrobium sp. SH668]|uniref:hypothetical protein n=1 Tax=Planctomicrobium sp. SH668 TaxID=3448126 RepID=UPI003F5C420E
MFWSQIGISAILATANAVIAWELSRGFASYLSVMSWVSIGAMLLSALLAHRKIQHRNLMQVFERYAAMKSNDRDCRQETGPGKVG